MWYCLLDYCLCNCVFDQACGLYHTLLAGTINHCVDHNGNNDADVQQHNA